MLRHVTTELALAISKRTQHNSGAASFLKILRRSGDDARDKLSLEHYGRQVSSMYFQDCLRVRLIGTSGLISLFRHRREVDAENLAMHGSAFIFELTTWRIGLLYADSVSAAIARALLPLRYFRVDEFCLADSEISDSFFRLRERMGDYLAHLSLIAVLFL